jgi:hypothetical protein
MSVGVATHGVIDSFAFFGDATTAILLLIAFIVARVRPPGWSDDAVKSNHIFRCTQVSDLWIGVPER